MSSKRARLETSNRAVESARSTDTNILDTPTSHESTGKNHNCSILKLERRTYSSKLSSVSCKREIGEADTPATVDKGAPQDKEALEKMKQVVKSEFIYDVDPLLKLHNAHQRADESTIDFAIRLKHLLIEKETLAGHTPPMSEIDRECLAYLRMNARPEISNRLKTVWPTTLRVAIECATEYECKMEEGKSSRPPSDEHSERLLDQAAREKLQELQKQLESINQQLKDLIAATAPAMESSNRSTLEAQMPTTPSGLATNWNRRSNDERAYRQRQRDLRVPYDGRQRIFCYRCWKFGHFARECRTILA